jgi:hypothetical protein
MKLKDLNLDFVPPDLEFVPLGLDFVPKNLDIVPKDLDFLHRMTPALCGRAHISAGAGRFPLRADHGIE